MPLLFNKWKTSIYVSLLLCPPLFLSLSLASCFLTSSSRFLSPLCFQKCMCDKMIIPRCYSVHGLMKNDENYFLTIFFTSLINKNNSSKSFNFSFLIKMNLNVFLCIIDYNSSFYSLFLFFSTFLGNPHFIDIYVDPIFIISKE